MNAEQNPIWLGESGESSWRSEGGSSDTATCRLRAPSAYAARTDPRIPAPYSENPNRSGMYASAIEARYVPDSIGLFDVQVTWTPRKSGSLKPQNPQPGDEFWEVSSQSVPTRVYYGLTTPQPIKGAATAETGTLIGQNPATGEVTGAEIESGGLVINLTQYRSESSTRQSFVHDLGNTCKKINAAPLFGFPERCVLLSEFRIQNRQSGVTPVTYVFHVRPPVDLSEMQVLTMENGNPTTAPLEGTMAGFEYLDLVTNAKVVTTGNTAKRCYYVEHAQIHRVYHTSNFSALGLSGVLA